MAIYHLNAKVISRSNGQLATAAAAYRAAVKIHDERTGLTFDYTRKQGVYATEILAPDNAPHWVEDRSRLWNAAELIEKRSNSRTAREFDIALPVELTHPQKQELVRGFVKDNFVKNGLVADIAFHDLNSNNPHVHIMITTRKVSENGLGAKDRYLDRKDFLLGLRKSWEVHANQALESIGNSERIDHRTLEEQNINRIPQIHLGANVAAMMKRGIVTERGEEYLSIQVTNQQIEALEKQLIAVEKTIKSETLATKTTEVINLQQTGQLPANSPNSALTLSENLTNQLINNDGDEREREASTEPNITAELRRINEAVIESNRQTDSDRQRLQNLGQRLRGDRGKTRKSGKSSQPSRTGTPPEIKSSSQQPKNRVQHPQHSFSEKLEDFTRGEAGSKNTPRQRDNNSPVNPDKVDRGNHGDLQSQHLGSNKDNSPQQQPTRTDQGASQQYRNQTQPDTEEQKSLTEAQRQADLNNLEAVMTIIRLMRYLKPEANQGLRKYEGNRYIFHVSTDEQTVELHAKDGRGLILEKKDGKVRGNLSDEDRQVMKDINAEINRQLTEKERKREQQQGQGRGFSR